jgi:ligand-binding sensor domain-containing protein
LTDNVWINALLKTSDGRVLAGIRNGVSEFLPDAAAGAAAFRELFMTDVVSLGEDAGGNLWVGTGTRGAFKLTRRGFTLYQTTEKTALWRCYFDFRRRSAKRDFRYFKSF